MSMQLTHRRLYERRISERDYVWRQNAARKDFLKRIAQPRQTQTSRTKRRHISVVGNYTVSKKTSPFLYLLYLSHTSSNFVNSWQKHTPGNLKQTQMPTQPHLVSYVRTVPCKI